VRNYAKRQMTWFKQTSNIQWIDVSADERSWETNERILDLLRHLRTVQSDIRPQTSDISI